MPEMRTKNAREKDQAYYATRTPAFKMLNQRVATPEKATHASEHAKAFKGKRTRACAAQGAKRGELLGLIEMAVAASHCPKIFSHAQRQVGWTEDSSGKLAYGPMATCDKSVLTGFRAPAPDGAASGDAHDVARADVSAQSADARAATADIGAASADARAASDVGSPIADARAASGVGAASADAHAASDVGAASADARAASDDVGAASANARAVCNVGAASDGVGSASTRAASTRSANANARVARLNARAAGAASAAARATGVAGADVRAAAARPAAAAAASTTLAPLRRGTYASTDSFLSRGDAGAQLAAATLKEIFCSSVGESDEEDDDESLPKKGRFAKGVVMTNASFREAKEIARQAKIAALEKKRVAAFVEYSRVHNAISRGAMLPAISTASDLNQLKKEELRLFIELRTCTKPSDKKKELLVAEATAVFAQPIRLAAGSEPEGFAAWRDSQAPSVDETAENTAT